MISEFCQYVIIGHSERRTYFGETDEIVNKKIFSAIANNLIPVVCIGETFSEKEAAQTGEVLRRQIRKGLKDLDNKFASAVILAYEPVWAIGTGIASSGENANNVIHEIIRPTIKEVFGFELANSIRVLYGGSVMASNADEFFSYDDIDGALVGGASLKADEFINITLASSK
jgi:triosephosphate isomerase